MTTELRFLLKNGKRILQSRHEIRNGESRSEWEDVPLVDLEKEREEHEDSPEFKERNMNEFKRMATQFEMDKLRKRITPSLGQ